MSPKKLRALRTLADHALSTGLRQRFNAEVTPQLLIQLLDLITDLKHPPKPPPIYADDELSLRRLRLDDEVNEERYGQLNNTIDHA